MFDKLKGLLWRYTISKFLFTRSMQEKIHRQEFFYNAFHTLSFNKIDGDYAEFGCFGCVTFSLAYHEAKRNKHKAQLWAFDSFQGFPQPVGDKDKHPKWKKGHLSMPIDKFHKLCRLNGIPRHAYHVIAGFYDETLTSLSPTDEPSNIALAYIDCDLYSSTKSILEFLKPRLKHGMIIAFDDYFCHSASQISGERKAMLEIFDNNSKWGLLPYVQFGWGGNSFIIEDRELFV